MEVAGQPDLDVKGTVVEVPAETLLEPYEPEKKSDLPAPKGKVDPRVELPDVEPIPSEPEKEPVGADPGEPLSIPSGKTLYAWNASALMGDERGEAVSVAQKISKEIKSQLNSKADALVLKDEDFANQDPKTGGYLAVSQGIFLSPKNPETMATALAACFMTPTTAMTPERRASTS